MTIAFFTGTPGSGKTYDAVRKIITNIKSGRKVYTNIDGMEDPLCHEAIKSLLDLDDDEFSKRFHHLGHNREVIENFWNHCEKKSLIVIDEAQKFFNNRDWQTDKNRKFGDWASTHRHEGYDLVIITQAAERIDSAVRALIEWNYVYRKVNFFGGMVQKKYLRYSYSGEDTNGSPLSKNVRHYNHKIFLCYKSYIANDIKEQGFMTHVNVLKHPVFFAIPVVLAICLYMVFFKSSLGKGDFLGVSKIQKESFAMVGTAEAKEQPAADPQPSKNNLSNPPAPIDTRRVKLNYVKIFKEKGGSYYRILFNRSVYSVENFPYPVQIVGGEPYSDIPERFFDSEET
ncbi:MAG: zonular occludens toxin domain-containing protein [Proteobacteria bacterium]|nr:zonular occludens toxin domain-containing protein [Pseudomonadota bacterium]